MAIPTNVLTSTAVAANVRLAISTANSSGNDPARHQLRLAPYDSAYDSRYDSKVTSIEYAAQPPNYQRPSTIKSIRTTTISPNPFIGFSLNSLLFGQQGRLPSKPTINKKAKTTINMAFDLGSHSPCMATDPNILLSPRGLGPYGDSPSFARTFT